MPIRLFVHVEEPSMETALNALLPMAAGPLYSRPKIIDHTSKQALLRDLPSRLKGYSGQPNIRAIVLVDRDNDDCHKLKRRLEEIAKSCGLASKTTPGIGGRFAIVNRIVVEELEAWFLGDTEALRKAYPGVSTTLEARAGFRDPDAVAGGTAEALLRVLQHAGHYKGAGRLPKIEVARRVSAHMTTQANRSRSFQNFVTGVQALLA